jgi:hypothetical protein
MKELCGQETEVCARIVGYYRPVSQWNKGKKAEFKDRQSYSVIPNVTIISNTKDRLSPPFNSLTS